MDENKILAQELEKLNAQWANAGSGTGWVGQRLPGDTAAKTVTLNGKPQDVLTKVYSVLQSKGNIIEQSQPDEAVVLSAMIGSGFMNMNPALVTVRVVHFSETQTELSITGVAKEGLIKQHAGEKAAQKIAALLNGSTQA